MAYVRLCKTLESKGLMVPEKDYQEMVTDRNLDWYVSVGKYSQESAKIFDKTKRVSDLSFEYVDMIYFDFDSELNLEQSQKDTLTTYGRLLENGLPANSIQIYFSGFKGFTLLVDTVNKFKLDEVKSICFSIASDLSTFDKSIYNNNRILRVAGTKHHKSGLYKIPISIDTLKKDIEVILQKSKDFEIEELHWDVIELPSDFIDSHINFVITPSVKKKEDQDIKPLSLDLSSLDMSKKPKFLTNCRWALQNGFFEGGNRSNALITLASTYKNIGFEIEHTYRILKGVCEIQAKRNNTDRFSEVELYNNIVSQVYGPNWKGGTFTCKEEGWLGSYCKSLGSCGCKSSTQTSQYKTLTDINHTFKDYVQNIEKNTVLTGIEPLDKRLFISTGANVGLIAAAGAGKTAMALNILNNTSKNGVKSVFASLDMAANRMYEKVLYKLSGLKRDDLYGMFKDNKEKELVNKVKEEFGNVYFFNKSCPTVQDLREYIIDCQNESGEKIKLVMVDYFERIMSDMSDDTAASKKIAGELQDIVNDLDVALITLVQPNKFALSGGPDTPIYDYTKIKGSSYLYQSFRLIFSLWRPFYNPKDFTNDKYMQFAILKNDLGELSEFSMFWDGKRGDVRGLEEFEKLELEELLRVKRERQQAGNGWGF